MMEKLRADSGSNVELIAEVGQAHEGSLGMAHAYIDALADTGVDTVKWQIHIAEAESSPEEPFRVKFSKQDATRMDYWRRMEFTMDQWREIKSHCESVGVQFLASPFSQAAVDLLEEIGVSRYKIGSGEVLNFLMLEKIGRIGKPVLLSSGMSSLEELDEAVHFIQKHNNPLSLFQCTTAYPTAPSQYGTNVIGILKERYSGIPIGFSDHSGDIYAGLMAATLGAELLEFHVVFDKKMFGPDVRASLTIPQVKQLVEGVRAIEIALSHPIDKTDNSAFAGLKSIFEKSLAVSRDLPAGHVLQLEDLEAKKPARMGIPAHNFERVIGRKLNTSKAKFSFLKEGDVEEGVS